MAHHIDKRRKQGSSLWTNVDYAAVTENSGDEFDDPLREQFRLRNPGCLSSRDLIE